MEHIAVRVDVKSVSRPWIEVLLSKVVDIERLQRRMSVGVVTPSELAYHQAGDNEE